MVIESPLTPLEADPELGDLASEFDRDTGLEPDRELGPDPGRDEGRKLLAFVLDRCAVEAGPAGVEDVLCARCDDNAEEEVPALTDPC